MYVQCIYIVHKKYYMNMDEVFAVEIGFDLLWFEISEYFTNYLSLHFKFWKRGFSYTLI